MIETSPPQSLSVGVAQDGRLSRSRPYDAPLLRGRGFPKLTQPLRFRSAAALMHEGTMEVP